MLRFSCPTCSARIAIPDEKAGITGSCPKCGQRIQIPALAAAFSRADDTPQRMPPGTRMASGLLVFLVLAAAGAGVWWILQHNDSASPQRGATSRERTSEAALASHPWWEKKLDERDISRIVDRVTRLSGENRHLWERRRMGVALMLHSNGRLREEVGEPDGIVIVSLPTAEPTTDGSLHPTMGGAGEGAGEFIHFLPGERSFSRDAARQLLARMLDQAQASREKRAKTGYGDTLEEQVLNLKAPPGVSDAPTDIDSALKIPLFDGHCGKRKDKAK